MKEAIMGLDGGGSNLRILVVDRKTNEKLYAQDINSGTNLSSVSNKEEALANIRNLILTGFREIPQDYCVVGLGLSSAGTEIPENKRMLEEAVNAAVETAKMENDIVKNNPPKCFVTNDIDILLHSADIALVAGTGTVGAVKYKDIEPYDNTDIEPYENPEEETIYKLDGNGYIGDAGSGYWIAMEILKKVATIENLEGYMNRCGEFVAYDPEESYLVELVYSKVFEENGISREEAQKLVLNRNVPAFVSLVYSATTVNGQVLDRAKVGNLFGRIATEAAYQGDEAANDVLEQSAQELFKNIMAAYKKGKFAEKEFCKILLSGSVLVKNNIVRWHLEHKIREKFPNAIVKVNTEKPVWSTIRYVDKKTPSKEPDRDDYEL